MKQINGVAHQAATAARQVQQHKTKTFILPPQRDESWFVCGWGAEELIYLRVMSRQRLLCREEIPFRSADALLHFILLAHSLVEWQEAKKED